MRNRARNKLFGWEELDYNDINHIIHIKFIGI